MSPKLFEQFLRAEIARHPSLVTALKRRGNLRHCSLLFEEAAADLHYRLIRRAVQLLLSQSNASRLRQLGANSDSRYYSGGGRDGGVGGIDGCSPESKGIGTDSSCTATPCKTNGGCCSPPMSPCSSHVRDAGRGGDEGNTQWERQSNNSQKFNNAPCSAGGQAGGSTSCCRVRSSCASNCGSRWTRRSKENSKFSQPPAQRQVYQTESRPQKQQCQQKQQQEQHQGQQRQHQYQPSPCQPTCTQQPTRSNAPVNSWPKPMPHRNPNPCSALPPPQSMKQKSTCAFMAAVAEKPTVRDGPAYNYPTASRDNRQIMASWYVANMDALLSNLMRLFEKIYVDSLRMCGTSQSALQKLHNALPDPTLMSLQQRTVGPWRPNFMNCKIDFLLHIAAMVYRITQNLRCGCKCPEPIDFCSKMYHNEIVRSAPVYSQEPPRAQVEHNRNENRSNADAVVALGTVELNNSSENDCKVGVTIGNQESVSPHQIQHHQRHHRSKASATSDDSSWTLRREDRKRRARQACHPKTLRRSPKKQNLKSASVISESPTDTITADSAISVGKTRPPCASWRKKPHYGSANETRNSPRQTGSSKRTKDHTVLTLQRSCVLVSCTDAKDQSV